jgi:hypothetical protein
MEIYRHKFTQEISEKIAEFSSAHSGSELADFKSHWSNFLITNKDIIDKETTRLNHEGMTTNVLDNMFTSARYWHTKKLSREIIKDKKDKSYVTTSRVFLVAIDSHIQKCGHTMKPSDAFDDFCEHNLEILKNEIAHLKAAKLSVDDIRTKIKKTFKNRHFVTKRVSQQ